MAVFRNLKEIPVPDFATADKKSGEVSVYTTEPVTNRRKRYVIGKLLPNGLMNVTSGFKEHHRDLWEHYFGEDKHPTNTPLCCGLYAVLLWLATKTDLYSCIQESFGCENGNALLDFASFNIERANDDGYLLTDYLATHASFSTAPKSEAWYSRLFSSISQDEIISFKERWIKALTQAFDVKKVWLAVKGTNFDCESENPSLAEHKQTKSDNSCRDLGQITAIATDINMPVTWFTYKGKAPDANALKLVADSLSAFGIEIQGIILDHEHNQQSVVDTVESLGFNWVMMLSSDCEAHRQMFDKHAETIRYGSEYFIEEDDLFAISGQAPLFKNSKRSSYVSLFFNAQNSTESLVHNIKEAYNCVNTINHKIESGIKGIEIPHEHRQWVYLDTHEDGTPVAKFNHKAFNEESQKKGFYSIASSLDLSCVMSNHIYSMKADVEDGFSVEKTQQGFKALRVHSDESIHSWLTGTFISCILRSMLAMIAKAEDTATDLLIQGLADVRVMAINSNSTYSIDNSTKKKYLAIIRNLGMTAQCLLDIAAETCIIRGGAPLSQVRVIPNLVEVNDKYGFNKHNGTELSELNDTCSQDMNTLKKRQLGRPKGSKNKSTLERESQEAMQPPIPPAVSDQPEESESTIEHNAQESLVPSKPRSKGGRPKGSKNKKTLEREAQLRKEQEKRGRGRPKGSKNKSTLEREALATQSQVKRGRGRPKGSKNKKTLAAEAAALQAPKRGPGRPKGSRTKPAPPADTSFVRYLKN